MIQRHHRFRGRSSILRALKRGRVVRGQYFSIKHLSSSGPDKPWRLAVVVSRKVHKSAVVRNRIRRRIYEQVRLLSQDTELVGDYIVIVHHENLRYMPVEELKQQLLTQLQ